MLKVNSFLNKYCYKTKSWEISVTNIKFGTKQDSWNNKTEFDSETSALLKDMERLRGQVMESAEHF